LSAARCDCVLVVAGEEEAEAAAATPVLVIVAGASSVGVVARARVSPAHRQHTLAASMHVVWGAQCMHCMDTGCAQPLQCTACHQG
jgi:hypothetical protein